MKYKELADQNNKIIFGGRLGEYKYYDMDTTVEAALKCIAREFIQAEVETNIWIEYL